MGTEIAHDGSLAILRHGKDDDLPDYARGRNGRLAAWRNGIERKRGEEKRRISVVKASDLKFFFMPRPPPEKVTFIL
ncbi:MAG: hypothetical protein HY796_00945 [Elusimicrobia bacterium]|nr:hypothetical protein [Elusimicrobiota bacterium]